MEEISLLFAVEAEQYLVAGMTEDAIDICLKGIEKYPNYPIAYNILALAYNEIGDSENSVKTIRKGISLFPSNKVLVELNNKLSPDSPTDEVLIDSNFSIDDNSPELEETDDIENLDLIDNNIVTDEEEKIPILDDLIGEFGTNIDNTPALQDIQSINSDNIEDAEDPEIEISNSEFSEFEAKSEIFEPIMTKNHEILKYYGELKASNLTLIPGFGMNFMVSDKKFGKLRQEHILPDPPPFDISIYQMPPNEEFESLLMEDKTSGLFLNLAKKLTDAKITPKENYSNNIDLSEKSKDAEVVSETIALIYEKQGAYGEALKAFKTLLEKNPGKKEFYLDKIHNLESKV